MACLRASVLMATWMLLISSGVAHDFVESMLELIEAYRSGDQALMLETQEEFQMRAEANREAWHQSSQEERTKEVLRELECEQLKFKKQYAANKGLRAMEKNLAWEIKVICWGRVAGFGGKKKAEKSRVAVQEAAKQPESGAAGVIEDADPEEDGGNPIVVTSEQVVEDSFEEVIEDADPEEDGGNPTVVKSEQVVEDSFEEVIEDADPEDDGGHPTVVKSEQVVEDSFEEVIEDAGPQEDVGNPTVVVVLVVLGLVVVTVASCLWYRRRKASGSGVQTELPQQK